MLLDVVLTLDGKAKRRTTRTTKGGMISMTIKNWVRILFSRRIFARITPERSDCFQEKTKTLPTISIGKMATIRNMPDCLTNEDKIEYLIEVCRQST